ncbi:MAG: hypothetical protein ACTSXF_01225, partial [Promethearchaeota archaeon]
PSLNMVMNKFEALLLDIDLKDADKTLEPMKESPKVIANSKNIDDLLVLMRRNKFTSSKLKNIIDDFKDMLNKKVDKLYF